MEGCRLWEWLHNGKEVNGWIELGQCGALRTSFDHFRPGGPPGYWKIHPSAEGDELIVTFGNCHHTLHLDQVSNSERPEFQVTNRVFFAGEQHDRNPPRTRGRLVMKYYGQSENYNVISANNKIMSWLFR